ncbi:MAG TPA: hypothetical protein VGM54_22155 [Chthoniobacter sp.]|jgi:hypothetical protein
MKKILIFLSAAFLTGPLNFAQTVTLTFAQPTPSDSAGFATVSLPRGGNIVVPTLVNAPSYEGNATFASTVLTPTINPGWTPGAFAETNFASPAPNYPTYYVEITAGTYEGYSFDIITNDASTLTVPSGDIPAALVGQTMQIAVRKHVTLDAIAAGQSGLTAYVDALNVINSDGTTSTRYFTGTSWVAEDYSSRAGQTVIYPATGFTITTAGAVQLVLAGSVKATITAVPLYTGPVNVVGPLNPVAGTLLVNSNLASAMAPYVDVFNVYSTDGTVKLTGTYYSDGTNILNSSYSPLSANATDTIPANSGVFLSSSRATFWMLQPAVFP